MPPWRGAAELGAEIRSGLLGGGSQSSHPVLSKHKTFTPNGTIKIKVFGPDNSTLQLQGPDASVVNKGELQSEPRRLRSHDDGGNAAGAPDTMGYSWWLLLPEGPTLSAFGAAFRAASAGGSSPTSRGTILQIRASSN